MMDKQELIKVFLYCYAGLLILFAYLVYRFFDSEIKRLNPPRKPFIPLKESDIICVDFKEMIKQAEEVYVVKSKLKPLRN